jgi:hypothetical protein
MDKPPHLARLFFVDECEWIEVLDFCGEGNWKAARVEGRNGRNSADSSQQLAPDFRGRIANSAD